MDFVKGYLTQADENGDVRHVAVFIGQYAVTKEMADV